MSFLDRKSLYVNTKKELLESFSIFGFIIFWIFSWMPNGFYLGGNASFLGNFHPELEVVLPFFSIGIYFIFFANFLLNFRKDNYLPKFIKILKTASLLVLSFFIISIFSRDFSYSALFITIWITAILAASISKELLPDTLNKKLIFTASVLAGFLANFSQLAPIVSIDFLAISSLLGLVFVSDKMPRNFRSKEFLLCFLMKIFFLFVITQSSNIFIILASFFVLIFHQKIFLFGRGKVVPDFIGILFLTLFLLFKFYQVGFLKLEIPQIIPHFWGNFREILFGVGQGQFLPALQQGSLNLLSPSSLNIPDSGFLLMFFEQGLIGIIVSLMIFVFSIYLYPKRSFLYVGLIFSLFVFSSVFLGSENGIILFMILLFANREERIVNR